MVNARGTKNLPGRKSDVQECQWLRKLHTYGLLRNSFRPPEQIRGVRTIWRLRDRRGARGGTLGAADAEGADEDERAVGQRDQRHEREDGDGDHARASWGESGIRGSWPNCATGGSRPVRKRLAHSLEGNWREDMVFELGRFWKATTSRQGDCEMRRATEALPEPATRRTAAEEAAPETAADARASVGTGQPRRRKAPAKPRKNQPAFDLAAELRRLLGVDLTIIDGIKVMTAQTIYAELGPDLSGFASERHFASWLGLAPRRDISGGKVIQPTSGHVSNRVANALRMAAESLKASDSYLGAKYRQLRARLEGTKAVKAMARYLACVVLPADAIRASVGGSGKCALRKQEAGGGTSRGCSAKPRRWDCRWWLRSKAGR